MRGQSGGYVIVSPVRDEEPHVEACIESMAGQTLVPDQWVLVNDGSTDRTGEILDRAARTHPWITAVHLGDRGHRLPGTGVIMAFYEGYKRITSSDWKFLVKLDGDLILPGDYFQRCVAEFARTPRLGITGGTLYHVENGSKVFEPNPRFHVRGATKMYRRECWAAIQGLEVAPGWDTIDEVKAQMLGWDTRSLADVNVLHRRPTGAADGSWRNAVKDGRANYFAGYHPLFMVARLVRQAFMKPYGVVSAGLLYGFVTGYLKRMPRVDDPAFVRYLRRQQLRRLLFGKTIWR